MELKSKKNGDMELKRDQILILFNVLQDIIPYLLLTLRFGNKTLRSKWLFHLSSVTSIQPTIVLHIIAGKSASWFVLQYDFITYCLLFLLLILL